MIRKKIFTFVAIIFFASAISAEKAKKTPVFLKSRKSIPLPGQSQWSSEGMFGGLSIGQFSKLGCGSHLVWQGKGQYFYTPSISGGGGFRISGGALDNTNVGAFTRYFINSRFHLIDENTDLFFGGLIGLDNSNFTQLEQDVRGTRNGPATTETSSCTEAFSLSGLGLGYELGAGWKFSKQFALLLSHSYEHSFHGKSSFQLSGGFAMDIRDYWDHFRLYLGAVYLYLEYGLGVNLEDVRDLDQTIWLGGSLAY